MNILVTGAKGFVGKNLVYNLKNIKQGNDRTRPALLPDGELAINDIYEYDLDSTEEELDLYCRNADFVFNLAGVNRPKDNSEFMSGNFGFASVLLDKLEKNHNRATVMLSSSIQASLEGRFSGSEYGKSKLAGEKLFQEYGERTGAKVLIYRFPNIFGKWCRPNYNSALATFCNAVANDLEYHVDDPEVELELLYIDDLVSEMMDAIEKKEHHSSGSGHKDMCYVPTTHKVTLGKIVSLLNEFKGINKGGVLPEIPNGSFDKKLFSTYLSYLPEGKNKYELDMKKDERGSFTELIKTVNNGQVSVNISRPDITKGNHWHNTKCEIFIVVSGHAAIRERNIVTDEVREFQVSGDRIEAVYMLPGYTHSIKNLSSTDDLVTIMWANELFENDRPDTYSESV